MHGFFSTSSCSSIALTVVLALAGCSTVAAGSGTDGVTGGETGLGTTTFEVNDLTGGSSPTGQGETGSDAATTFDPGPPTSTGDGPSTNSTAGATDGPSDPSDSNSTGLVETGTASDTDAGTDTDTGTGTDTGAGTGTDTGAGTGTTEPDCVPSPEVCNDLDDDCNDLIDDLDVGMDGICDCLSIALVGNQGYEPSSKFQQYLEEQGTTVERINSNVMMDINAPLTPDVLAEYDIIILDWLQRSYTADEAENVRAWVEGGAGLMTMTGHTNEQVVIDRSNSFISPLGLKYNGSKGFFNGPVTQFAPHPITQGLTSITFLGGLYIDVSPDNLGVNTTIMTLPQGPVGVVQERVEGRVFVFGDEWVEFDSQWQNMEQIKQFWVQTLSYLGPKNSCIVPQ